MANLPHEVQLLQAVADENRLRLLGCLLTRSACVCELVQATGLSQPRVSRHLRVLRNAGLVVGERAGQWVEYSVPSFPGYSAEGIVLTAVKRLVQEDPQVAADRQGLAKATRDQQGP